MAQDHVCEYSWSEYEYKYEYIASDYEYKYLKLVLEYLSTTRVRVPSFTTLCDVAAVTMILVDAFASYCLGGELAAVAGAVGDGSVGGKGRGRFLER